MSSIGDKSVFETFERMTEQIEHEERKLIAAAEGERGLSGDTLVKQFQTLEVRADADQQLNELKRKWGSSRRLPGESKQLARERRMRSWSRMTTLPPSGPAETLSRLPVRLSGATFVRSLLPPRWASFCRPVDEVL